MPVEPYLGALDIARAYRSGETTAREIVDGLLARIETHDPKLGSFQAVYADDARLAAEAADAKARSGHWLGPFHGVPFAAKDVVDIEGRITTGGSLTMVGRVSPATATIAQRLIAAGGILIGKTKTMEFSMGGWGTNLTMGTPWNPWDMETHRTPGGSSSGSGVAVAAGLVPCAIGTDTGGSVRTPSAWNGTVGLKTTEGFLPIDGLVPCSVSLDTPGPMTRSVADAAFMFDVMTGHESDRLERHLAEDGFLDLPRAEGVDGLCLGALQEQDREGVEDAILALYDEALQRLRSLGAEVVAFEPPMPWQTMAEGTGLIFTAEGYVHYGALMEDPNAPVDEDVRRRLLPGRDISAHDYISAVLKRPRAYRRVPREHARVLGAADADPGIRRSPYPCPTSTRPPIRRGSRAPNTLSAFLNRLDLFPQLSGDVCAVGAHGANRRRFPGRPADRRPRPRRSPGTAHRCRLRTGHRTHRTSAALVANVLYPLIPTSVHAASRGRTGAR